MLGRENVSMSVLGDVLGWNLFTTETIYNCRFSAEDILYSVSREEAFYASQLSDNGIIEGIMQLGVDYVEKIDYTAGATDIDVRKDIRKRVSLVVDGANSHFIIDEFPELSKEEYNRLADDLTYMTSIPVYSESNEILY